MRAIKASFMNITPTLFDKLYGTFIRPHLEYSFQAWRPWLRKGIKLLEGVQRHSTKLVKGLQDIEYEERAQLLNLDSLSCRMDKGDMILVYKFSMASCMVCLPPDVGGLIAIGGTTPTTLMSLNASMARLPQSGVDWHLFPYP